MVAGALETGAIGEVKSHQPMATLKEPVQKDMETRAAPELFCFGLAEWFDVKQLEALLPPAP